MEIKNRLDQHNFFAIVILSVSFTIGCTKAPKGSGSDDGGGSGKYIYVASGSAYVGNGITPTTASKTIAKYDTSGNYVGLVKDYSNSSADNIADIKDYDSTRLLVLIENTGGRRVEFVAKDGSGNINNIFSFSGGTAVRSLFLSYTNHFILSRTATIEKYQWSGSPAPNPNGGTPYITNPGGTCGTSTNIVQTTAAPSPYNFILYTNAAASPNNRVVAIKAGGYGSASDCLASTPTAPTVNHWPTALLMHSSGVLFVAYGNNTGAVHQIYAFNPTFTATTASFGSNPSAPAFNDLGILQGISTMVEMPDGTILVAAAGPTMNTVERLQYDATTGLLSRVTSGPFIGPTIFTRSVSGIAVGN